MKKISIYIKRAISVVLFFAIVASLYWFTDRTMKLKRTDGITSMQNYYVQPEGTIDVLLLGSSHAGMNFDTETMWTSYGISAYALWGSLQPFYNSYYFLQEAIDTNKPKIVVLDTYAATFKEEYSDESRQVTNIVGMKYGLNRIKSVMVSAPHERWEYLMMGLPLYHTRYNELSENDFSQYPWTPETVAAKGTSVRYGVGDYELWDASEVTAVQEINEKQKEYLLKIIELCKAENIELVLVKTPTVSRVGVQEYYNSVQHIADEHGLEFVNYNLLDEEVGFTAEDFWTDGHANTNGCRKISAYMAEYLKSKYDLEDHRGDKRYSTWDENAIDIQNRYFRVITGCEDYFLELKRNAREIAVVKYNSESSENDLFASMDQISESYEFFPSDLNHAGDGVWLSETTYGNTCERYSDSLENTELNWHGNLLKFNADEGLAVDVNDDVICETTEDSVIIFIYDKHSGEIEDMVLFTSSGDSGEQIVKMKHYSL